jgi:hypothetical protein
MKNTYYISISKTNDNHILHNATCRIYSENKEDMILIGRYEQLVIALGISRNNFRKVVPCAQCILKRRHYNMSSPRMTPVPVRHFPE